MKNGPISGGWPIATLNNRGRQSRRALISGLLTFAAAGCTLPTRLAPVPAEKTVGALPLGLSNVRFFPSVQSAQLIAEGRQAVQRQRVALGLGPDAALPPTQFLSLSGGGDDGAFGAGILVGWSEAGNRPEFQFVTGVSTGALMSPLAFLGQRYDPQLRAFYTTISAGDIFEARGLTSALFDDALSDTTPLWKMISNSVNDAMMADLAAAYQNGRILMVGTTNLDAQQPCLWNIGAIAASGQPGALDLIRKILRASSAVPGIFQPVLIDIELDGQKYQELHVDGGAIAQMFLYPPNISLRNQPYRERKAYLIRNGREEPEWTDVKRRTLGIAGRAISTMLKYSGKNDLFRIYATTQRDGVDFNLAYIGPDFTTPHKEDFDKAYMNALFDYAYQQARHGYPWKKAPPFLATIQE